MDRMENLDWYYDSLDKCISKEFEKGLDKLDKAEAKELGEAIDMLYDVVHTKYLMTVTHAMEENGKVPSNITLDMIER